MRRRQPTKECPVCCGYGAELDGTYPCTGCKGRGRLTFRRYRAAIKAMQKAFVQRP